MYLGPDLRPGSFGTKDFKRRYYDFWHSFWSSVSMEINWKNSMEKKFLVTPSSDLQKLTRA